MQDAGCRMHGAGFSSQTGRVQGQGAGFILLLLIPVVRWVLAPGCGVAVGALGGELEGE